MSNVSEWSVTAGSNNSSPPNGWPEGMARSAVNDCAREMMAAVAKWYNDSLGTLTTAGGTTAYTLTTNSVHAALSDIPMMSIKFNAAPTGASTLDVDGLGAKSLTLSGGVAIASGNISTSRVYVLIYDVTNARFEILNASFDPIPSGTPMLFVTTAAPTGWTKGATHNNKALRLVTGTAGTGGSTAFTSVFASRTIAQANLPNVALSVSASGTTSSDGAHTHNVTAVNNNKQAESGSNANVGESNTNTFPTTPNGAHTHTITVSGSTSALGSGTAMDFAVQYVDVIMATRN